MPEQRPAALATYWSEKYFPALDGLRAICILLVMFNHVHEPVPGWIQGRIGVDIFFVLSGFLITTLLLRERERYGNISLKGFYTRRFYRIVPVYVVAVLFYICVILVTHDAVRWKEFKEALPYLATFMQEYRPASSGIVLGHAWSLGIEEKFYLLWPLFIVLLFPFRRRSLWVTLAMGVPIVLLPHLFARSYGGLFLGALLAVALAKSSGSAIHTLGPRFPTWVAMALVAIAYGGMVLRNLPVLFFSAGVTLLTGTLVLRRSWLRSFLEQQWIVTLGKRSYAMYLIHVLLIHFVERVATRVGTDNLYVVIVVTYLFSFFGATVLFYAVERPCTEYGRRISHAMRKGLARRDRRKKLGLRRMLS